MKFKRNIFWPFFKSDLEPYQVAPSETEVVIDSALLESGFSASEPERYLGLVVNSKNILVFFTILLVLLFWVVARSIQIQIIKGGEFNQLAENNRVRVVSLPADRGIIFDRNGTPLLANSSKFALTVSVNELPEIERDRDQLLAAVAQILDSTPTALVDLINKNKKSSSIILAENLSRDKTLVLEIFCSKNNAFKVVPIKRRDYLTSPRSLAHVIGYEGRVSSSELQKISGVNYDLTGLIGKTGIEKAYEQTLRGQFGSRRYEVDTSGQKNRIIAEEAAVAGQNLTLALDLNLQTVAELSLRSELAATGKSRGSVVVMDPQNGEILALVSLPDFDPNQFSLGMTSEQYQKLENDPAKPLFPRAIAGSLPPGSTFKLMIAGAGLEEGLVDENTSVVSTGGLSLGKWFFPDWKASGHGLTNLAKAIAESVNTYFYILGGGYGGRTGLGPERIAKYARLFGFGSVTGLDIPGESSGLVPDPDWKKKVRKANWYIGDTYYFAIGQGDSLVTPLQIARMTAVYANGGRLVKPHVALDPTIKPQEFPKIISDRTVSAVRTGMRLAVTAGSARSLGNLPVAVAAKTGTAQWKIGRATHAWFTSFAPFDSPKLVITVVIEEGGEGSAVSAPVAKRIYEWYFGSSGLSKLP